jgi:serine/threonine-protein kinase
MSSPSDRVVSVFEAAVLRDPADRLAFVRDACADDPDVCRQVEAMLGGVDDPVMVDRPVGEAIADLFGDDNMVSSGTRFGPYQVESLLGAGGMGEVYRATDTVLGRQVAIKILPADLGTDPERTARFRREAKILASLNHSNIAAIYGVEAADARADALGLVLELVEGPTLADRLEAGPLPVDEALTVARQIAEALDAAHQQGVVHRDLKPGNVKVRDDGVVKVLDFGLARVDQTVVGDMSSGNHLADSPTITTPAMTAAGVLLGTAAYMSPEQAKGRPADKRSDIWAFGCVLYEMLSGTRAFGGDDVADTLASVLRGEPDYALLPRDTPEAIRALLRGCLTKDRHRRLSDMSAARFVLDNLGTLAPATLTYVPPSSRTSSRQLAALATVGALALAAAAGVAVWLLTRTPAPAPTEFVIAPAGAAAVQVDYIARDVAVLPNGAVVYKAFGSGGSAQLFMRTLDQREPKLLEGSGDMRAPFAAPDGQRVGFIDVEGGQPRLKTLSIAQGTTATLVSLDNTSSGITWTDDDSIIFATTNPATGLQRVSALGGGHEVITRPDVTNGEGDHLWPHALPDGRNVLFTIAAAAGSNKPSQLAVLDLETRRHKVIGLPGSSQAHYTSSGHLVYLAGTALHAVRFDVRKLEVQGTSKLLPYQVAVIGSGAAEFDIGRDGTFAYIPAGSETNVPRTLVWVDREARETPVGAPAREYLLPRLSPDNRHLSVYVGEQGNDTHVWNFSRRSLVPVTLERGGVQAAAIWLDNRHIAYGSLAVDSGQGALGRLMRRAVDGTGDAEPLARDDVKSALLPSSAHGNTLLAWGLLMGSDLVQVDIKEGRSRPWIETPEFERNGEISPNGRWVAYEASSPTRPAEFNVYVRPLENPQSALIQVSTEGGRQPAWHPNGQELFYVAPSGALMSVQVEAGSTFVAHPPRRLIEPRHYHGTNAGVWAGRMYDVSNDGNRFLMIKDAVPDRSTASASIVVTHYWLEQLKRLVPAN